MQTSAQALCDPLLQQMSERIECLTGLHFPSTRFADLQRGLVQAARESGCGDARVYAESLLSRGLSGPDIQVLAGSLTIGETHFFRDPQAFGFFERTLLPKLLAAKRGGCQSLRIWSAGCATGEEPYSMAILLHRLLPDLSEWHISILGTDINPKVLARAELGSYTEWSFRDTPAWVKPRYFVERPGGRYEIQPWLKRMVTFAHLNLADDDYPSIMNRTNALDLIICRNVLLYFTPARIPQVVRRFQRVLVEGGHLVMGSVECGQMRFPEFTLVPADGVTLYQKGVSTWGQAQATFDGEQGIDPLGGLSSVCLPGVLAHEAAESSPLTGSRGPREPDVVSESETSDSGDYAAARAHFIAGRYLDARETLMAGRGLPRPNDPRSAMLLVQCHANLGELTEALACCEQALASARTDVELHYLHANILQELERDEEALLALRNVLFLEPDHVLAQFTISHVHRRRNNMPAAARHLANVRQLLSRQPDHEELPQSGGLTVGRMKAIVSVTTQLEVRKKGRHHA